MKLPSTKYVDKTFWGLFIALVVVAIISLFSASSTLVYMQHSAMGPIGRQMTFLLLGVAIAYGMQFVPSWTIRAGGYGLFVVSEVMLYSLLIPGNPFAVTRNEAARWLRIAGIEFQPSELAKLALIIVVADLLSRADTEEKKRKAFYVTLGLTMMTILPVVTSNLSTAVLIFGIVFLMWILARMPWRYVLSTVGVAVVFVVLAYSVVEFAFIRPGRDFGGPFHRAITQVRRIDDKIAEIGQKDVEFKLTDKNYQPSLAKVAIARGGKSPIGVLPGRSKERDYLPQAFADYIFAIIVEETGIVGAALLIFLYLSILFRACWTSSRFGDYAAMLMVMGLALMITCQALISMMVAVGLGPVTGQPLPLVSRGGTSVLITSIYFGIMLCVSREQAELKDKQHSVMAESMESVPEIKLD